LTDFYGVHGFVAAPNGTITAFDSPDSENYYWLQYGLPPGFGGVTRPYAINPAGTVTGDYSASYPQPKTAYLGFVWVSPPTGKFTSFDPHPADSIETHPLAINPAGDITGYYLVYVPSPLPHTVAHGFLRMH
jgi:hypothetical protein